MLDRCWPRGCGCVEGVASLYGLDPWSHESANDRNYTSPDAPVEGPVNLWQYDGEDDGSSHSVNQGMNQEIEFIVNRGAAPITMMVSRLPTLPPIKG